MKNLHVGGAGVCLLTYTAVDESKQIVYNFLKIKNPSYIKAQL